MTVYLNLVVCLTFLVDGLLMLAANRLSGYPPGWKRVAIAAAVSSVYAGLCLMEPLQIIGGFFFRMLSLGVMSVIAFGWNLSAFRRGVVFLLLSMALSGVTRGMDGSGFVSILLAAVGIVILCRFGFRNPIGTQQYQPVELVWEGQKICLTAMVDTGNTLCDPVSGASVIVAGGDVAKKLGIPWEWVENPIAGLGKLPGSRLIPYRSVGCAKGLLLGVRCEQVRLNGRKVSSVVAFAPERLGRAEAYQVLAGGV